MLSFLDLDLFHPQKYKIQVAGIYHISQAYQGIWPSRSLDHVVMHYWFARSDGPGREDRWKGWFGHICIIFIWVA